MFATLYLLLFLVVALFSWVASIFGLLLPNGALLPSMLSADGIRWMVRHGLDNIASAPVVTVLVVLVLIGVLRSVGAIKTISYVIYKHKLPSLSRRQRYASRVAWCVFGVALSVVLIGVLPPGGNLLSVTGHISGGPLAKGWLLVLLIVVCVPCLMYGWIAGIWHTERDILDAFSSELARCSGYLVTLVIASQLMGAILYTGLFDLMSFGQNTRLFCTFVIYAAPLIPYYRNVFKHSVEYPDND